MAKRKPQELDDYVAVFNLTADERTKAKEMFITVFGEKLYDKTIQKCDDRGIMSIFNKAPNKYTLWWVTAVAGMVRQRLNSADPQGDITPVEFHYLEKKSRKVA